MDDKLILILKLVSVFVAFSFAVWIVQPLEQIIGVMDSKRKKRAHIACGAVLVSFIPLSSMIPRTTEFFVCLIGSVILIWGIALHLRPKRK